MQSAATIDKRHTTRNMKLLNALIPEMLSKLIHTVAKHSTGGKFQLKNPPKCPYTSGNNTTCHHNENSCYLLGGINISTLLATLTSIVLLPTANLQHYIATSSATTMIIAVTPYLINIVHT